MKLDTWGVPKAVGYHPVRITPTLPWHVAQIFVRAWVGGWACPMPGWAGVCEHVPTLNSMWDLLTWQAEMGMALGWNRWKRVVSQP